MALKSQVNELVGLLVDTHETVLGRMRDRGTALLNSERLQVSPFTVSGVQWKSINHLRNIHDAIWWLPTLSPLRACADFDHQTVPGENLSLYGSGLLLPVDAIINKIKALAGLPDPIATPQRFRVDQTEWVEQSTAALNVMQALMDDVANTRPPWRPNIFPRLLLTSSPLWGYTTVGSQGVYPDGDELEVTTRHESGTLKKTYNISDFTYTTHYIGGPNLQSTTVHTVSSQQVINPGWSEQWHPIEPATRSWVTTWKSGNVTSGEAPLGLVLRGLGRRFVLERFGGYYVRPAELSTNPIYAPLTPEGDYHHPGTESGTGLWGTGVTITVS